MRSLVYGAPRVFDVQEVERPRAGAGEAVVDVTLAGVCGTDLHLHAGGFFAEFPLVPGHESVGVVRQVGEGVLHLRPGQRVAVDNASACGSMTWPTTSRSSPSRSPAPCTAWTSSACRRAPTC
jgi:D-arabinitol dehydrogenase (NADP+)